MLKRGYLLFIKNKNYMFINVKLTDFLYKSFQYLTGIVILNDLQQIVWFDPFKKML